MTWKTKKFFADIVKILNIPQYENQLVSTDNIDDPILRVEEKFKNHQSIQLIKCHYENKNRTYCLSNIAHTEIEKELNKLDSSKYSPNTEIPTKTVKDNFEVFKPILYQEFNKSVKLGKFPSEIKLADVTSVFKKENWTNKENYRPISILSKLPKIFERCLTNFLYFLISYFQNTNTDLEKALMLKSCRKSLEQDFVFGALLTDFSKAFDSLSQEMKN